MFSRFFINRPIFSTVIAILMVLVGLITVKTLPVAQFPNITPPTVQVSASYPGADAKTVAETVGVPIEEQVNGIEDMLYMSSNSSSDGSYSLTITFANGTDLDEATDKVQNRVNLAKAELPQSVQQQGLSVSSRSTNIILFVALEGDSVHNYTDLYLTNYAQLHLVDDLARLPGVGGVNAFGAGEYSMRIWLDPEKMRIRGVTPEDVENAIRSQNMEVSGGTIGAAPGAQGNSFQYTLTAHGLLTDASQFADIVISTDSDGGILRLGDIARVDLGSDSYTATSAVSSENAGLLGVYQLPGANALDVAKEVKAKLAEMQQYFPPGVNYRVILDTTEFVTSSIDDVLVTFVETTLIVMLVILIFLQSWRAVIIPMLTIPVSLIATFAVMKLLGFSLNTLTLFGLVLAIAIVVDDAIVVVEDCARIVQKGTLTPRQAAIKAMKELQGPVVGEVLVLLSVFVPTAFISGITGELYKQFALTIAVSTAFSGFNALTFTPAMCALFLKPKSDKQKTRKQFFLFRWFNIGWAHTENGYTKTIGRFLAKPIVAIGIYAVICFAAFWGFSKWPTSYVPEEDLGYFMGSVELPTGASLNRTEQIMARVTDRVKAWPEVKDVITISGMSFIGGGASSNYGSLFIVLKPWDERKSADSHADALVKRFDYEMADIQESICFAINPPAIPGLGMTSGLSMQLLDINNLGAQQLSDALTQIEAAAAKDPRIEKITSVYQGAVPQYSLKVDRDKVKLQGLSMESIYSTLASYMGTSYVNDFVDFGRVYQVNLRAEGSQRSLPEDVLRLAVRNDRGDMVPFAAFATVEPSMGEATVGRYNMYTTAALTATPAKGVSSGEGIAAMEEIVEDAVGNNFSYAWTGEAYQETSSGTTIVVALLFAVIITILVLAAQYESWTDPIAVVISMPTAILGTVIGCMIMSQSISIYTQIGIILLLGLSAKNAILIVEYAMDYRKSGLSIHKAALQAGKVRFRPIMMTALAFVFGVMPMLFATGAGAASRISLGAAVVFGMAVNALVGTLFVPGFWELLQRLREHFGWRPTSPTAPTTSSTNADSNSDNNTTYNI